MLASEIYQTALEDTVTEEFSANQGAEEGKTQFSCIFFYEKLP